MESLIERLSDSAREGAFGPGRLLSVETNDDSGIGAQFASQIFFLRVVLETSPSSPPENVPIVVKIQIETSDRELMDTYSQFFNEVTMYKTVLPQMCGPTGFYPKMFMAEVSEGDDFTKDILVLEDLREKGYRVADDLFLDFDHMVLAMRKLGEFHGYSFKCKQENSEKIGSWSKTLRKLERRGSEDDRLFGDTCLNRGFRRCLAASGAESPARTAYDKLMGIDDTDRMSFLSKPEEPFACIIHGDFNKNNILFKYDSRGRVQDMMIFDFATSVYSDPSIDLSFILYMNTSPADRNSHWDKYLSSYWAGVTSICPDPGFNFDEFLDNFSKKAIYGYLPCSFFLPMMMFEGEMSAEIYYSWSREQKLDYAENHGGEEATDFISRIVEHLLEKGYLEQFCKWIGD